MVVTDVFALYVESFRDNWLRKVPMHFIILSPNQVYLALVSKGQSNSIVFQLNGRDAWAFHPPSRDALDLSEISRADLHEPQSPGSDGGHCINQLFYILSAKGTACQAKISKRDSICNDIGTETFIYSVACARSKSLQVKKSQKGTHA